MTSTAFQIRSARELREALTTREPARRLGALKAIGAQPAVARALGLHEGQDVVDLLVAHANRVQGHADAEWLAVMSALSVFRDDRVTALFVDVLATATEPTLLYAAARYLAAEPGRRLRDQLRRLLLQDDCPARPRAIAPLLAREPALTSHEQLRIALLVDDDGPAPPCLDETSGDGWLAELNGPFSQEARVALEAQGAVAFENLVTRWDRLADETREWLAGWGMRALPDHAGPVIERALAAGSDRLALIALESLAARGDGRAADSASLQRFVAHPVPALRRAAIVAGGTGVDWRQCLASDPDPGVRQACVPRLAAAEGLHALPALLDLLREPDWRMRSVVTTALVGLGETVVVPLRPRVHDPEHGVRIAAVQVLLALGQEAWLASHLAGVR